MKKVFFAAVLGVIVLGNSYAASAIKELKLEAPSSTLENAGILPVAAAAKVKKSADADKNQGTLFIIERFPANYGLVNVIVERDMRRESGALLAEYKATDYGYELTTKFPGGKAGTLTMIEMFPKKMFTRADVLEEAQERRVRGFKVDVVEDANAITVTSELDI